ncbi:hypothetical protein JW921_02860 [Candidatus Fermentibacterales bacterium]|nr:hypothetical protein [Candidatus Fermentibacterales bacterium]
MRLSGPGLRRVLSLLLALICPAGAEAQVEDVYSVFGKLYITGYLEYEFLSSYDFLSGKRELLLNRNEFDFDYLFLDGIRAVLVIEETEGRTRSMLRLGDVPATYNTFVLSREELNGMRWTVERGQVRADLLLLPDVESKHVGLAGELRWQDRTWSVALSEADAIVEPDSFPGRRFESRVTGAHVSGDFSATGFDLECAWDRLNREEAAVLGGYRLAGPFLVRAEAFRVAPGFDARATVQDNDDGDHTEDWNERAEDVIPLLLDRNNNGIVDYDDDFLMWEVDDDFLRGEDWNNNGIRDREENDLEPDYRYPVDRQGMVSSVEWESGDILDLRYAGISAWADSEIVGEGSQWAVQLAGGWEKQLLSGRLDIYGQVRRVRDGISESLVRVSGSAPIPERPLFPDDIYSSLSGVVDVTSITNTFLSLGARLDASWRLPEGPRRLYQVGVARMSRSMPLRRDLQLVPMAKLKIRHGFLFSEREDVFTTQELALAKLVYEFTRSTTITAGFQYLMEQDRSGGGEGFSRATLQAELDHTFTAYGRQMFLHMALREVFQYGETEANDAHYRTAFVRVYADF